MTSILVFQWAELVQLAIPQNDVLRGWVLVFSEAEKLVVFLVASMAFFPTQSTVFNVVAH